MDKFRKIATDPYYAGVVYIQKQINVRNENGVHEPLISMEQHKKIVAIFNNKVKTQIGPRKGGNPEFPLSNLINCDICKGTEQYGRYVGYNHGNGKNPNLIYQKYRCRGCNRYSTRQEIHDGVEVILKNIVIDTNTKANIVKELTKIWNEEEKQAILNADRIKNKIRVLNEQIEQKVEAITDPDFISIKDVLLNSIDKSKTDIIDLELELDELQLQMKSDKADFLEFAYEFIENISVNFLDTDLVSPENRLRCKNLIFPAGFWVNSKNKVYTPQISPLYRLATTKKDVETSDLVQMVRVIGKSLHLIRDELKLWRSVLAVPYQEYLKNK